MLKETDCSTTNPSWKNTGASFQWIYQLRYAGEHGAMSSRRNIHIGTHCACLWIHTIIRPLYCTCMQAVYTCGEIHSRERRRVVIFHLTAWLVNLPMTSVTISFAWPSCWQCVLCMHVDDTACSKTAENMRKTKIFHGTVKHVHRGRIPSKHNAKYVYTSLLGV